MRAPKARMWAYDMWSAGVVWLELVLATPHVFQIGTQQQARLDARLGLRAKAAGDRQLVYLLRGMMEMCLYPPQASCEPGEGWGGRWTLRAGQEGDGGGRQGVPAEVLLHTRRKVQVPSKERGRREQLPVAPGCTEDVLLQQLAARDPSQQGLQVRAGPHSAQRVTVWPRCRLLCLLPLVTGPALHPLLRAGAAGAAAAAAAAALGADRAAQRSAGAAARVLHRRQRGRVLQAGAGRDGLVLKAPRSLEHPGECEMSPSWAT
jgi:hypothetical protein